MIFLEGSSTPTYRHDTLDSAEKEALRLTEMTGRKSFILKPIKSVEIPPKFIIKSLEVNSNDEDLPF